MVYLIYEKYYCKIKNIADGKGVADEKEKYYYI